jgi:hypothetical protein
MAPGVILNAGQIAPSAHPLFLQYFNTSTPQYFTLSCKQGFKFSKVIVE